MTDPILLMLMQANRQMENAKVAYRNAINNALDQARIRRVAINHLMSATDEIVAYQPPSPMTRDEAIEFLASGKNITPEIRKQLVQAIQDNVTSDVDDWSASWNSSSAHC